MVYARPTQKQSGKPLTFGVSGRLWRDTLIMFDRESRSLWSQLQGRSVWGDMEGASLEKIPSVRTTWGEWKKLHPKTLALSKPAEVNASPYAGYFTSPDRMGVTGRKFEDDRLPGKTLIYGLEHSDKTLAVPLAKGVEDLVHAKLGRRNIWVVRAGEEAIAWEGQNRLLWNNGQLQKGDGSAAWDAWTGEVVKGSTKPLKPVDGFKTYWFTWASFHPSTDVLGDVGSSESGNSPPQTQTRPSPPQTRPSR